MHRAYTLVRLNDVRIRGGVKTSAVPGLARRIALALAVRFRELDTDDERAMLPCDPILRDVVTNLGVLFGHPANVSFDISTDPVSLPAYKRRALVLTTAELVSNALLHGFQGSKGGRIEVGLTCRDGASASLQVADNGGGFICGQPNLSCGVASGLADLLESELTYSRAAGWTIAQISIPLSGS
jgi:two-component sensor histidine kinase